MTSVATVNVNVTCSNAKEMAERVSNMAVLHAKIGGLYEDMATELKALASLGDKDAKRTKDAPAAAKAIGGAATESAP